MIRHLRSHGCVLQREGGRHSIWINPVHRRTTAGIAAYDEEDFINPVHRRTTAVPRHNEINEFTARSICRDLGIRSI